MAHSYKVLKFVGTTDGGPPRMMNVPLLAGTAYYAGQTVRFTALGSGSRSVSTAIAGVLAADILSADISTAKTGGQFQCPMYLADTRNIFSGRVRSSIVAQSRVGEGVDLVIQTVHNQYLGTTPVLFHGRVVGYDPIKNDQTTAVAPYTAATGINLHFVFTSHTNWTVGTGSALS